MSIIDTQKFKTTGIFETSIPHLAFFMHRLGPIHEMQMAAIGKHTKCSYSMSLHFGPGTAHANMNKAIAGCRSRYLVIMDDDVVPMVDYWLEMLIETLDCNESIGLVTPLEVKRFDQSLVCKRVNRNPKLTEVSWCPGYIMAIDRMRCPSIVADESIPGPSGMSDLDISFQVRAQGFVPSLTDEFTVYHPDKPRASSWRAQHQIVQAADLGSLHLEQVEYMAQKWGSTWDEFRVLREIRQIV